MQLLTQLLRPFADLIAARVPDFVSVAQARRLQLWRQAASVALGRTQAGATYKKWLQTTNILSAADAELVAAVQARQGAEHEEGAAQGAQGVKRGPDALGGSGALEGPEVEPMAKRPCPATSAAAAQRRKQETRMPRMGPDSIFCFRVVIPPYIFVVSLIYKQGAAFYVTVLAT